MSPGQFHDDHHIRKEIAGPRPSPLKINKDSHLIHKSSSSTISSAPPPSFNGVATAAMKQQQQQQQHNQHQQRHHPVIIYTHSPKVIHADPRDFMTLVQKLTGFRSDDDRGSSVVQAPSQEENGDSSSSDNNTNNNTKPSASVAVAHEDNESSSVVTDENCSGGGGCGGGGGGGGGGGEIQVTSSSISPSVFEPPANPFFSDIPLFTPNSTDFFCSPRRFYRYSDSMFTPSNVGSSISPSFLEVMKGFQGY